LRILSGGRARVIRPTRFTMLKRMLFILIYKEFR
jgi:hypothetical protein